MQVIWRLGPRGQGPEARARRLGTGGQGWGPLPRGYALETRSQMPGPRRLKNVQMYGWTKYPLHSIGHRFFGAAALFTNYCIRKL